MEFKNLKYSLMPHSVTGISAHCLPPPHRVPWVPSPQTGGGCLPREVEQNVAPIHTVLGDHQHLSPHVSRTFPYFPVLFSSHNFHLLLPVIPSLSALPSPSLPSFSLNPSSLIFSPRPPLPFGNLSCAAPLFSRTS